jgi:long-chain-fatty-acid--CoA ligase ACSBG
LLITTLLFFSDALKGSIGATLKDVRPTVFFGVPRVWEKIYGTRRPNNLYHGHGSLFRPDKLQEVAKSSTGIKKMLSTWAKSKALEYWESREFGKQVHSPFLLFLARKLLGKAHVALGFDRCRAFFVSAAPIEVKILKYFTSLDIPIMGKHKETMCASSL